MQLHISIAEKETWVVGSEGCNKSIVGPVPDDCAKSRGRLFKPQDSRTWQLEASVDPEGFFNLSEQLTRDLGTNAVRIMLPCKGFALTSASSGSMATIVSAFRSMESPVRS